MRTVFYTIISDSHYHGCRTDEFIKSFKHFHSGIELTVFGQDDIDFHFSKNPELNFYNCKAYFAKLLYDRFDLVVNIDADHLILGPLDSILNGDYDVACPANYNKFSNAYLKIESTGKNSSILVWEDDYFQGGLIASTRRDFWDAYHYASIKHSANLFYKENDVLNLLLTLFDYKVKYLDGAPRYDDVNFKEFYGCASLGQEQNAYVEEGQIKINGKPVKAYHFAKSGISKVHPKDLFPKEVVNFIYDKIVTQ